MKLIASELKAYPEIAFRWKEVGLSFQVQFVKLNFIAEKEQQQELQQKLQEETLYSVVLKKLVASDLSRKGLSNAIGQKSISGQLNKIIAKLIDSRLIERTIPKTLNNPAQKFKITPRGRMFL